MASLDVLYLILGVCVVVITVTIVWLASETRQLVRSLKRSAQDTEVVTKEIKEKVLLVGEALDRAGTAATTVIGLIEDAIEQIEEKRDQIVGSIGLLTGAGKYVKQRREGAKKEKAEAGKEKKEVPKAEVKEKPRESEKKEIKNEEVEAPEPISEKKNMGSFVLGQKKVETSPPTQARDDEEPEGAEPEKKTDEAIKN